jgi:hypothetical protein
MEKCWVYGERSLNAKSEIEMCNACIHDISKK